MAHNVNYLNHYKRNRKNDLEIMDRMLSPTEKRIINSIIPSFAKELSISTGINVKALENWNEENYRIYPNFRVIVSHALMKMYFNEMLVDNIGGAYDRVS